jgi:hypothetical protein
MVSEDHESREAAWNRLGNGVRTALRVEFGEAREKEREKRQLVVIYGRSCL